MRRLNAHEQKVAKQLCEFINERQLISFYFESVNGNTGWRIVEPYIFGIKDNGNGVSYLCALPVTELVKEIDQRYTGHYDLNKIDLAKLEVLDEVYDMPKVDRKRIADTPTIVVLCRYRYEDEE